jgi:hypothetical protein
LGEIERGILFSNSSLIIFSHNSHVQTGTVDLFINTLYSSKFSQTVFATIFTNFKSALWLFSLSGGVQTAEKMTLQKSTHSLGLVENLSLHSL